MIRLCSSWFAGPLAGSALMVLAIVLPVSAADAQRTGSRVDTARGAVRTPARIDAGTPVRVMNTFARCLAGQNRTGALNVINLPYGEAAQGQAAERMIEPFPECLGRGSIEVALDLEYPPTLLAGGMAEHLITREHRRPDLQSIARMSDDDQLAIGMAPRNGTEILSSCVVRADPEAAYALVATDPTSAGEDEVFERIIPHLGPCVPDGLTVSFGKPALRALLATGLYRMLNAASDLPRSGGNGQ